MTQANNDAKLIEAYHALVAGPHDEAKLEAAEDSTANEPSVVSLSVEWIRSVLYFYYNS